MAKTYSTMLPLGTKAPDFSLSDVTTNQTISLATFANKKALLVIFLCKHCPYVKHINEELGLIGKDYQTKDIGIIAICANDEQKHPEDGPEGLKQMAQELNLTFPICFDQTQETAKAYTAACTPDIFLFNKERKLAYRGQLDDSRPGNMLPVTGKDLRTAIDAVLEDREVPQDQKPSMGCGIKWKPGNEPPYFNPTLTSAQQV